MKKRIAINGFGRIGRLFYRALLENNFLDNTVELVAINDLVDAHNLAYLLKYDSTHGKINYDVTAEDDDTIKVKDGNGNIVSSIETLAMRVSPEELPWTNHNIDVVIESTGLFTDEEMAKGHISAGAKKVIISAPAKGNIPTYLEGVNASKYNGEQVISNASCTTNCMGPIASVLLREGIGIEEGLMSTIHAYTASQPLQDGPSKKDFRKGRAGAVNVVPTTTGAARALGAAIPEIDGKVTGMAFRVPVQAVSTVDFTFRTARDTSLEEINEKMKAASEDYLKGILGFTNDPVVSSDFIGDPHSAIYDAYSSMQLNSRFFKLIAWYDNEWGYSNRLVDILRTVVGKD
jgi:glyceraldehyde 3-phosphate dehydrogenase